MKGQASRTVSTVFAIAVNTFKEAIRNRVLHGIIFLALCLVAGSIFMGQLSVENDSRVIRDLGVSFTSLVVVLVAIFSGVSLLYLEIERKTIYTIVTRPVARWAFILGKYLGLVMTLLAVELLVGVVLLGIIGIRGDPFGVVIMQALILIFFEGAIVAAIATLFSSFSSPFLSALFTLGIFVLGRLREQIFEYAGAVGGGAAAAVVQTLGAAVPDLTLHRADLQVAYLVPLNWSFVGYTGLYSTFYLMVVVVLSCAIFSRRDFV